MKVVYSCLVLLHVVVSAGPWSRPQVTIGLNIGEEDPGSLGGVEPRLKWDASGNIQGFNIEGGIDVIISEVDEIPSTYLWAKLKRVIPKFGCDVSIRGDMDGIERDTITLDVRANGFPDGTTSLQLSGNADLKSNTIGVSKVQVTKKFDVRDGILTMNPKYHVQRGRGDVTVRYALDNTNIQIDAGKKKVTVAQSFNDQKDIIIPSIEFGRGSSGSYGGECSLSYSKQLGGDNGGRLTTTWTPDDSIKFIWSDGEWDTTIKAPLNGLYRINQGLKISMKRNVGVI